MQVKIEEKGALERQINIKVPSKDVDQLMNERLEQLSKTVKVPGFRPGKVPVNVVKQRFGEKLSDEIAEHLIQTTLPKALEEQDVKPATRPHVHAGPSPEEGKDFEYHAHFEIMPDVKPKNYEGLKLTRMTAEVTDKLLDDTLERLHEGSRSYKEKKGKAAKGDRVTINATGYKKGDKEPFEGGELKDFPIVIGSGSLIPGFEEELEGLAKGDKKDFDVTFPMDYHSEELAGQKATFKTEVVNVEEPEQAKPDDKLAQNFGLKNLAELREKLKEQLSSDIERATDQRLKRELFDALDKENTFDVPKGLVEAELDALWNAQMQQLKQQGISPEMLGKQEDEMRAEFKVLAARRVRLGLLLAEIGSKHQVKVGDDEIKAEIERIAASYGPQADQVRAHYQQPARQQELVGPIFERKVTDWLIEKGEVKDKKVDANELLKELG